MDFLLTPILDALRVCLCSRLEDKTEGSGCFCGIYPGATTNADWCSCKGNGGCGMGWVRLDRVYPSQARFPSPDSAPAACTTVLAAVIEVGTYRCQPVPDRNGNMDPAAVTQAALTQVEDMWAMVEAIKCCEPIAKRPHHLGTYLPRDGGGCGGGSWQVTVQLVRR